MMPTLNTGAPQKDEQRPRIVVVANDLCDLALLSAEIESRYGSAYSVLITSTPSEALASLEMLRTIDQKVALVLASQWIGEMTGSNLLSIARKHHPRAKRVLLISPADWGHEGTADAIRGAMPAVVSTTTSPIR